MDKFIIEHITKTIIKAALILAGAIIFTAWLLKPRVGRYTFTPDKQNWVLVGDTKTGKSWSCVAKVLYKNEDWFRDSELTPENFDGCLEMSVPPKVQKSVSYEGVDEDY
jgi:hypothetical protein